MPQVEKRQPGVRRSATLSKHWGLIALNFRGNAEGFSGLSFSRVSNFFASMWTGDHFFSETFWPLSHKKKWHKNIAITSHAKAELEKLKAIARITQPTKNPSISPSTSSPGARPEKLLCRCVLTWKLLFLKNVSGDTTNYKNPIHLNSHPQAAQNRNMFTKTFWGSSPGLYHRAPMSKSWLANIQATKNWPPDLDWLREFHSNVLSSCWRGTWSCFTSIFPLSIRVFLGHILPIWINCCNSNLLSSFLIFLFFSELPIFGAKKKAATTRNDGRLLHKMSMSPRRWMYRQTRKKNIEKLKRWGCFFFGDKMFPLGLRQIISWSARAKSL